MSNVTIIDNAEVSLGPYQTYTALNMQEHGFSLTRILPYTDRIVDSVLMRKSTGQ